MFPWLIYFKNYIFMSSFCFYSPKEELINSGAILALIKDKNAPATRNKHMLQFYAIYL